MNEEDLSSKFSYRPILKELARRTARASNLDELFAYFTRFTSAYAGLEYFGVLLLDKERDNYTLIRSLNRTKRREKILPGLKLSCTNPLIRTLKSQRTVLNISSIKFDLRKKDLSFNRRKDLLRLKREMQRFGVKLVVPCFSEDQLLSVFLLGDKSNREMFVPKDEDLFLTIADQLAKPIHNFIHKREAIEGFIRSQDVVIRAVEAKDPYTRGHSERVAEISFIIGEKLGLEAAQLEYLKFAARLHDIGKIAIKDEILHKEGKLTPEEYAKVKEHPIESVKMIQPIASQLGRDAIEAIMHHHENLNGTGYPSGQKDGDIHMFAKIIRCADSLDALVTIRPYRKRKTHIEAVLEELNKNKGIEFDPLIVDTITVLCRDREFVLWLKHLIEKSGAVCRLVIE
jgi:HD-GYP domain-containing protein (c-di-GMP phosphodiesterase class II)